MLFKLVLMHDVGFIGVLYSRRTRLATRSSAGSQPSRFLLVKPYAEMNSITETGQGPVNKRVLIYSDAIYRIFDVRNSNMSRLATHSSAGSQPIRLLLVTSDTEMNNIYGNWAMTVKYEGSN